MEIEKMKKEIIENDFIKEIKILWGKYTFLVIISFILLLLIIATPLWNFIDGIATASTLVAVIVNMYINNKNKEKLLQKIKVFFQTDGIQEEKPRFEIVRKDFTRAEISGYLSEIRFDSSQRFNINHLSTKKYFDDIINVQKNIIDEIVIEVEKDQLDIFKRIE